MVRQRIHINGVVQGIGFRPYIYRVASELGLNGYVSNDSAGVIVEIEGDKQTIDRFHQITQSTSPPLSSITRYTVSDIHLSNDSSFIIKRSDSKHAAMTLIPPDIATCDDCLRELFDRNNRRYRYPFINCTKCGPRYTIVHDIPYDRPLTSMSSFTFCADCLQEYENPADRRFHAQPNACPVCGPQLTLHNGDKSINSSDPVADVVQLLVEGNIVAIKGIGGFHLVADPFHMSAVEQLRIRKGRAEKPFALMADSVETIRKYCVIADEQEQLLKNPARPIVILKKRTSCCIPDNIAPRNRCVGIMLPYSPLHNLLLHNSVDLLVMTSANYSEEPIAMRNDEAIEMLRPIADYFLLHDREILQRCDDSVVQIVDKNEQYLRRSRGYVPLPIMLSEHLQHQILAVGAEQKNTIALARDDTVFISQHIGDLDNPKTLSFFRHSISHLANIFGFEPSYVVHDLHPDYLSTKWARSQQLPTIGVQHHHAHMVSVMTENNHDDQAIGLILDGTGYGTDGTIWGGEVLFGDCKQFERFGSLSPVAMPGGAAAIREPWRMALSYLYSSFGDDIPKDLPFMADLDAEQIGNIIQMIKLEINSPLTSSCGRLFDAISALLGVRSQITFEAQAAIELEMFAAQSPYVPVSRVQPSDGTIDVTDLIRTIVEQVTNQVPIPEIALYAHYKIAEYFIASACSAREHYECNTIAISGGVFQNILLNEYISRRLREEQFSLLIHKNLPVNDGGIALGQIMIAKAMLAQREV